MEDKHRTILWVYRPNIVNDLEPNNTLLHLGSVLTPKDEAEIKAQSTRQGRCEQLLDLIPRKGPNAFKVFVEALKKEAPHLADVLIAADVGVREQSANLRREIRDLKTKLEEVKQDHTTTSQELKQLKSVHETFKTDTSQQIRTLAKTVQRLTGDSSSSCKALGNWRDFTKSETVTLGMKIEELTKTITQMIIRYQAKIDSQQKSCQSLQEHEELSKELKAANDSENHQREIEELKAANENHQREIEDLSEKNKESKEELEKSQRDLEKIEKALVNERDRAKGYQQKLEEESKAAEELRSTDAMKIESLQKELNEEKSKSETLRKEVQRLTSRQIPGRTRSYRSRRDFDRRRVVDDFVIIGNGRQ